MKRVIVPYLFVVASSLLNPVPWEIRGTGLLLVYSIRFPRFELNEEVFAQ